MKKKKPCYSLQIGLGILMIMYWLEPKSIVANLPTKWMDVVVSISIVILFVIITVMNYHLEER